MSVTLEAVLQALGTVQDPDLHRDIVTLGFVKDVRIDGEHVGFTVELTTPACPVKDILKEQCETVVRDLAGVSSVEVTMTARVRDAQPQKSVLPGVKNIIAVASGKGGVGKSTVTVNVALALAQTGAKVGIMDADVYGPSIPFLLGCQKERPYTQNQKILPVEKYGLVTMSLGYLLDEGQQPLWRGPMVAGTVKQLLDDVTWGELDYLLVDLPPGTGDAPMTLAQSVPLSGVVVVTTPQDLASNIAGRSILLFNKLEAPVVGIIENMSGFVCPNCHTLTPVFSGGTGQDLAWQFDVPYLGSIPLDPAVGGAVGTGKPVVLSHPDGISAQAFKKIAGDMVRQISMRAELVTT